MFHNVLDISTTNVLNMLAYNASVLLANHIKNMKIQCRHDSGSSFSTCVIKVIIVIEFETF